VKVIDTLTYFGALRGLSEAEARSRSRRLLEEMGLGDAVDKKAAELSRGMHQKAQLIATILNDPDLLIVDEPFQGLDPLNADMLKGVVREQRDRGAAVIMSTHDMGDAQTLCDRILLIDKGRRLLYGTVARVRDAFSDGAVEVSGKDIPRTAGTLQSVVDIHQVDGAVRYVIREGATPQDLFRELAAGGAQVDRFAVQAPSLDEIFIRTVEGDRRAEAVR
jgi:ABC-2 type transport system ATP-binding protein